MNVIITFPNNKHLTAELNGDCYIINNPINIIGTLSKVIVDGEDYHREYNNAQLIKCASIDRRFWFSFIENVFDHNGISPLEQSFTASRRYKVGELVTIQDKIYEVISLILPHSNIKPGCNVRETTLEEYINKKAQEALI